MGAERQVDVNFKSSLEEAYETAFLEKDRFPEALATKVNPMHYRNASIEPIDVIESWDLGFHLGNAIKYIKRAGQKEGQTLEEDLSKAVWYLQRAIMRETK